MSEVGPANRAVNGSVDVLNRPVGYLRRVKWAVLRGLSWELEFSAEPERVGRTALLPLQWHVFGVVISYFFVVGPASRFDGGWWLPGRLASVQPSLTWVLITLMTFVAVAYVARFGSARNTRWEHALRHVAVACILVVPALAGAGNQKGDGQIIAFAVAGFALPFLLYVRPIVAVGWLALSTAIIVGAAFAWQEDVAIRTIVVSNVSGLAVFTAVVYTLIDGVRMRTLTRIGERLGMSRLRETVFHAIDHDLKTPLLRVKQVTRVLAEGRPISAEDAERFSRHLDRSTNEMMHVIGNLTAIGAAPETGAGSADDICDVGDAVRKAVEFTSADAEAKDVRIACVAEDGDAPAVGSGETVLAILRNLVTNAVKFSHRGSEVRIGVGVERETIRISVDDDGVGIPPSVLVKVEGGVPVRGSHGTAGEVGSGLGLVVARSLAATLGSTLIVRNRPEGGVSVSFELTRYRPRSVRRRV